MANYLVKIWIKVQSICQEKWMNNVCNFAEDINIFTVFILKLLLNSLWTKYSKSFYMCSQQQDLRHSTPGRLATHNQLHSLCSTYNKATLKSSRLGTMEAHTSVHYHAPWYRCMQKLLQHWRDDYPELVVIPCILHLVLWNIIAIWTLPN